jgi:hypothetical protein
MSGLLGSLIARNLGGSSSLRARSLSLFEPSPASALSTSPPTRIQSTMRSEEPMTEESNWILNRAQDFPAEEADIGTARQRTPVAREVTPHKRIGIIPPIAEIPGDGNASLSLEEARTVAARPRIRTANIQSAPVAPPRASNGAETQTGPSHPPRSPISALAGRAAEETPTPFRQSTLRPSAEEGRLTFGRTQSSLLDAATTTRNSSSERVETASLAAGRGTRMDYPAAPPLLPAKRRAIQSDFRLPAQNPEPSIHVTIGRIEIRAEREGPSPRKNEKAASPVMGLEEYLRRKNTRGKE